MGIRDKIQDKINEEIGQHGVEKVMGQVVDSPALDRMCHVLASYERRQLDRVATLHEHLDVEEIEDLPDVDDRKEELKATIKALPSGDVDEVYRDRVLAERLDTTEGVEIYLGMGTDSDEWQSQIETWAALWRDRAGMTGTDREIAGTHVATKWGVTLEEFEANIVDFSEAEMAEEVLTGNFDVVEAGLDAAIDAVDEGGDDGA